MNPNRIAFAPILLVTLSFVFLHGCGGEPTTFPASGTVKFADGTPLVGALVEFQLAENTAAPTAKGSTGADGNFQLGTFDKEDGAFLGRHMVMIMAPPPALSDDWEKKLTTEKKGLPTGDAKRPEMDLKYRSFATSGLSYTVTEDGENNHFDIVVDAK